jgi:hypothetical protein
MDTMWAVSAGEYSAYRVLCICPSLEVAEAVKAKWNAVEGPHNQCFLEEFPVVSEAVDRVEFHSHSLIRRWDGKRGVHLLDEPPIEETFVRLQFPWEKTWDCDDWVVRERGGGPVSNVRARHRDPNEAAKIAREIWAKHEAERLGL